MFLQITLGGCPVQPRILHWAIDLRIPTPQLIRDNRGRNNVLQQGIHSDHHLYSKIRGFRRHNSNQLGLSMGTRSTPRNNTGRTIQMHHQDRANLIRGMAARVIMDGAILLSNRLPGSSFLRPMKMVHPQSKKL